MLIELKRPVHVDESTQKLKIRADLRAAGEVRVSSSARNALRHSRVRLGNTAREDHPSHAQLNEVLAMYELIFSVRGLLENRTH